MSQINKPVTKQQKTAMKNPYVYKKCPRNLKLQPGKTYLYCACGLSENQPFCDNSHIGTKFEPIFFEAKNVLYSSICLCRHAHQSSLPYCDGSHSDLDF